MKKKRSFIVLLCIVTIAFGAVTVHAENMTGYYNSGAATAGAWKTESNHSLTYSSVYDHLSGGDAGTWFYENSVGLQDSFVVSTLRTATYEAYEYDTSASSTCFRKYKAYFALINGLNQPYSYSTTYTYSGTIESDGALELYLRFLISTRPGDTSSSVPAGLITYRYWAY